MKVIRLLLVAVSMVAWAGGVIAWFYTVYHGAKFFIRWWQDTPADHGRIAKFFFSRLIWFQSEIPERARPHRQKAFMGATAFLLCWVIGLAMTGALLIVP
jgi:hypothetical protein